MLKVLVTDYVFDLDGIESILAEADAEVQILQCKAIEDLLPHLPTAHGILNTYLAGIGPRVFEAAPNLKAVVRYGIGVDTIDIPAATERGIRVANVPDYCIDEVSDHAMSHFLALARRLTESDRRVRNGEWSLQGLKPMPAIRMMRVAIIGFGRIGQAIASRLKPFGCEVVFFDPVIRDPMHGCAPVTLDELFATADAIMIQCPANDATRHLLRDETFAQMKKQPIIINCARGEIIDTPALMHALQEKRIRAAGLDVLEDPDALQSEHECLKSMDNVVLSPHSAWFSDTAIPTLKRRGAEVMAQLLRGEKPASILNPQVWNESKSR